MERVLKKNRRPRTRVHHTATLLTSRSGAARVLVAGGAGNVMGLSSMTEWMDVETGEWSLGPKLLAARWSHRALAEPDGGIVVFGGKRPMSLNVPADTPPTVAAERLASGAAAWIPAEVPRGDALPSPREGAACCQREGRTLAFGGMVGAATCDVVDALGDDGAWVTIGRLQTPRAFASATALPDGTVLVLGGFDRRAEDVLVADIERGRW